MKKSRLPEVIDAIDRLTARYGYPPTFSELAEELGMHTKSHVDYYIKRGVANGLITYKTNSPRTLRTLK